MMPHRTSILLLALAIAACGSKQNAGDTGGGEPALEQVLIVDWGLEEIADPDSGEVRTRVSLTLTDETGAAAVEPMDDFAGRCSESGAGPGNRGDALLALSCRPDDGDDGTELRVRRHGDAVILLRAPTGPDVTELSFEEAGRVPIPTGASVRAKQ